MSFSDFSIHNSALLVGQSGGCTAVINASLHGVADEARRRGLDRVYGMAHGIQGLLAGKVLDLGRQDVARLRAIARTPSGALGSCRFKLSTDDAVRVLDILQRLEVRWFIYIGGNDSADTVHRLAGLARERGQDLTLMLVPKTIDNDLPETDHCPGYGSAARTLALFTQGAGIDTEATHPYHPVKLIEVMGRDAGWLAATSALAKRADADAPHLLYIPERRFTLESFLQDVRRTYDRLGFCVAVVAETVRDPEGNPYGSSRQMGVDQFGHAWLVGAANQLCQQINEQLGLRARYDKPGSIQRSLMATASESDLREAEMAGRAAVRAALKGVTDHMVTLVRAGDDPYACVTGLAPLERVANVARPMPVEYLTADGHGITESFRRYLRPLAGELPDMPRLEEYWVPV